MIYAPASAATDPLSRCYLARRGRSFFPPLTVSLYSFSHSFGPLRLFLRAERPASKRRALTRLRPAALLTYRLPPISHTRNIANRNGRASESAHECVCDEIAFAYGEEANCPVPRVCSERPRPWWESFADQGALWLVITQGRSKKFPIGISRRIRRAPTELRVEKLIKFFAITRLTVRNTDDFTAELSNYFEDYRLLASNLDLSSLSN